MANQQLKIIVGITLVAYISACNTPTSKPKQNNQDTVVNLIVDTNHQVHLSQSLSFSADSAFAMIEKQLSFGPRVPNSKAHLACGDFLIERLKQFTPDVIVQPATVMAYTGESLKIRNIMARFNKEKTNRIVFFAHWDTRPFADRDPAHPKKPVLGADDGASGVAILLELARILALNPPEIGVDLVLFDGEDYGDAGGKPETYCLGSQYWAKNIPVPGYYAKYGILLDMVGARNARFCKEGWSLKFAPTIVDKVWTTAHTLGFGHYFIMKKIDPITDDHYFVNTLAKIPTIDIINHDPDIHPAGFGSHWHTLNDNIDIIDKNTLLAVGQTLVHIIYSESANM